MKTPDPVVVARLVESWLAEDIGRGDRTSEAVIPADLWGTARVEARSDAVVAGIDIAAECFAQAGRDALKWVPEAEDGERVGAGDVLARVEGPLRPILAAERTALNILQRLSGVATFTSRFVEAVAGTSAAIVDTRKTTPGLRSLEKYAVTVGGGTNHRFGLDDGILIKDNHIAAAGSVVEAVRRARATAPHGLRIEVEVQDLAGLDEALVAGAEAVLLDNMSPQLVRAAVERTSGRALLEASGGITLANVRSYAETGVGLISIGALTHSAPAVDLALEVGV